MQLTMYYQIYHLVMVAHTVSVIFHSTVIGFQIWSKNIMNAHRWSNTRKILKHIIEFITDCLLHAIKNAMSYSIMHISGINQFVKSKIKLIICCRTIEN